MVVDTVIFDFGNVIFSHDPRNVYREIFNNEKDMNDFLDQVYAPILNVRADLGDPRDEIIGDLVNKYPHYDKEIKVHFEHWDEMFSGHVDGVLDIVESLYEKGIPLYGLTNWSAERADYFLENAPRLKDFKDIVVSGVEKVMKPSPEIYKILLNRNSLDPERCLFVDDRLENIQAGEKLGIRGHHFTNSEKLLSDLQARSLL